MGELEALIAAEFEAIDAIRDLAAEAGRELTKDELVQVEGHTATAEKLLAEREVLTARLAVATREADLRKKFSQPANPDKATPIVDRIHDSIEDDPTRGYASLGEFAVDVANSAKNPAATDPRLRIGAAASGLSQGVGADGGFLLPPMFSQTIWNKLQDPSASLLALCDQWDVDGESLTIPANAETSRANGSRWGGVRGYWQGEAEQMTSTKPKLREMTLSPHELAVYVLATNRLIRRSSKAIDKWISEASTDELNFKVGKAIVNGTGAGEPKGIMNSAAKITVTRGTANLFVQQDVANMWARMHARAMGTSVWLIDQSVIPELLTMTTPVTNVAGTENVGGFNAKLYNADNNTLMGRPVLHTEYGKALGTEGDVILVDLGSYAAGVRGGVASDMSIHLRFDYNETAFRFLFEADGQTWLNSAITPFSAGDTISSVVTLSTV
jgi:HK97 family phage major capsid protein